VPRDYSRVMSSFWIDDDGAVRKVPTIRGRLKCGKCPGHAALRAFIIRRDRSCRQCGAASDLVADHIVSRRNGGSHHPDNLQALCQSCNSRKANLVDRVAA
jgi:5-methylcytosine-specific restriction endonuclease McrA